MLMLTRKTGQRVYIGPGIVVEVVDNRHGHVSLGITAPPDVQIWREEIAPVDHPGHDAKTYGGSPVGS